VRLVLDTNTVISGLLWQGTPGRLIDAAQTKSITLCTSVSLLAELHGVLAREKFVGQLQARALNVSEVFDGYAALAMIVAPADIASIVINDPTDDAVLACALAAQGDLIVSGDPHLRNLKIYHGIHVADIDYHQERRATFGGGQCAGTAGQRQNPCPRLA
jgi:putative PIN family toxin of toxin-antitoxin system